MSKFVTCKMQGIVLAKEVAQESCRIIKEALSEKGGGRGLPGEIRTGSPEIKRGQSVQDYTLSLLVRMPANFFITGVEIINDCQLEFEVQWYMEMSDEAINQLYIVPVYISDQDTRTLIAFHARV